jgi:hypothetical protein
MRKQNIQQRIETPAMLYGLEAKKAKCTECRVTATETDEEEKANSRSKVDAPGWIRKKMQESNYERSGNIDQQGSEWTPRSDWRERLSDRKPKQAAESTPYRDQ